MQFFCVTFTPAGQPVPHRVGAPIARMKGVVHLLSSFVDLHCHLLSATDDGAKSDDEMYAMLDASYADGVRHLCVTPHFHTELWQGTPQKSDISFEKLLAYAARYPDLHLYRGNELLYQQNATQELSAGHCRTLNGSRYVLVDFPARVSQFVLTHALQDLRCNGYTPVLAHVERYVCLHRHLPTAESLVRDWGLLLQVNASSLFGEWGHAVRRQAKAILRRGLCAVIASDAHGMERRKPGLSSACALVNKMLGEEDARRMFFEMPLAILENRRLL